MSLKDQLFAAGKTPALTPFTFLGQSCFVKQWTERERIEWAVYTQSVVGIDEKPTDDLFLCRAVAQGLCDDQGQRIFTSDEDIKAMLDFPSVEVQAAFNAVIAAQQPIDAKKN